MLRELELQVDDDELPDAVIRWLTTTQSYIREYWDKSPSRPLARYTECDFHYVASAILNCDTGSSNGAKFLEWGCGFGAITGVAALLGMEAVGIESEKFLVKQARKLIKTGGINAQVLHGNFLPNGAHRLATEDDPNVSLTSELRPAYETYDIELHEFAMIYAYAWPGEEHFLKLVFGRYCRPGALLLLFRGPYHIELYRNSEAPSTQ